MTKMVCVSSHESSTIWFYLALWLVSFFFLCGGWPFNKLIMLPLHLDSFLVQGIWGSDPWMNKLKLHVIKSVLPTDNLGSKTRPYLITICRNLASTQRKPRTCEVEP